MKPRRESSGAERGAARLVGWLLGAVMLIGLLALMLQIVAVSYLTVRQQILTIDAFKPVAAGDSSR